MSSQDGVSRSLLPQRTTIGWQAPLAVALQTTTRSVVECCGWPGNSCVHGCGYVFGCSRDDVWRCEQSAAVTGDG
jgi:hypothetical protein